LSRAWFALVLAGCALCGATEFKPGTGWLPLCNGKDLAGWKNVGRYKSEFLAGYWQRHSVPLKVRAFGRIDELAAWGSRLAPIVNAVSASGVGRRLAESMLGIDRRRRPPQWAWRTLRNRLNGVRARTPEPRAVLFADTFTSHVEPEIGVAAFEVLVNTMAVANIIRSGESFKLEGTMQVGAKEGMKLMENSLEELLKAGLITGEARREYSLKESKT